MARLVATRDSHHRHNNHDHDATVPGHGVQGVPGRGRRPLRGAGAGLRRDLRGALRGGGGTVRGHRGERRAHAGADRGLPPAPVRVEGSGDGLVGSGGFCWTHGVALARMHAHAHQTLLMYAGTSCRGCSSGWRTTSRTSASSRRSSSSSRRTARGSRCVRLRTHVYTHPSFPPSYDARPTD